MTQPQYHYWRLNNRAAATTHIKLPLEKRTLCGRALPGTSWRLAYPTAPVCSRCSALAPRVVARPGTLRP